MSKPLTAGPWYVQLAVLGFLVTWPLWWSIPLVMWALEKPERFCEYCRREHRPGPCW
jgi:hypothetical protein